MFVKVSSTTLNYFLRKVVRISDFCKHYHKAVSLNRGAELPSLLREMAGVYQWAGFYEIANNYHQEALKLDGDSAAYLNHLGSVEYNRNHNYEKAIQFFEKATAIDSTRTDNYRIIGLAYMYSGHHEESLRYLKKWLDELTARGQFQYNEMHRVGYAYWQNGYKKEAEYYFDIQMEYGNNLINSDRPYAQLFYTYYDRAGVYAFRGEKEKAYEDLRIFYQRERQVDWMVRLIKDGPLFDSIRDEEEFQQIVRDVEAKYQAEHKRVRKWLEENDLPG